MSGASQNLSRHGSLDPPQDQTASLRTRATTIIDNFDSELIYKLEVVDGALSVSIRSAARLTACSEPLKTLARILALQLGISVCISQDTLPSSKTPSNAEDRLLENCAITASPAIYVVVQNNSSSDDSISIPDDIRARIASSNTPAMDSLNPNAHVERARSLITELLTKHNVSHDEWRITQSDHYIQIIAPEAPEIIEIGEFYELLHKMAQLPLLGPVVLIIAPPQSDDASLATQNSLLPSASLNDGAHLSQTRDMEWISEQLLSRFGTSFPFSLGSTHDTTQNTITIFIAEDEVPNAETLLQAVNSVLIEAGCTDTTIRYDVIGRGSERLISGPGSRASITRTELAELAHIVRAHLRIGPDSQWATVMPETPSTQVLGNCIEVTPKAPLSPQLLHHLQSVGQIIPASIIIHPLSIREELSLTPRAIKTIVELSIPSYATVREVSELESGEILIGIDTPKSTRRLVSAELYQLETHCAQAGTRISLKFHSRTVKLARRVKALSLPFREHILTHMNAEGLISLKSWSLYSDRTQAKRFSIQSLIQAHSQIVDCRALAVKTLDPHGATNFEDGYSIEIDEKHNRARVGVHFANAAIHFPPFSEARYRAYMRGSSLYSTLGDVRDMYPMLPGASSLTFQVGRDAIAISHFSDYEITWNEERLPLITRLPTAPSVQLSLVKPASSHHYNNRSDLNSSQPISSQASEDFSLLYAIARSISTAKPALQSPEFQQLPAQIGSAIATILEDANHTLADMLYNARLPALFQGTEPLTSSYCRELSNAIFRARLKDRSKFVRFADLQPNDFEANPLLLRELYDYIRELPLQTKEELKIPRLLETISYHPAYNLHSGYDRYAQFNTGFRRLVSLVGQHQINALLGINAPLSQGEIEALLANELKQREEENQLRIKRDLEIVSVINFLKKNLMVPWQVTVVGSPQGEWVEISPPTPLEGATTSQGRSIKYLVRIATDDCRQLCVGDNLLVRFTDYSLAGNFFISARAG